MILADAERISRVLRVFSAPERILMFVSILDSGDGQHSTEMSPRVSRATLYRAIEEFAKEGLVERFEKGIKGKTRSKYLVTDKGRLIFQKIRELDSIVQSFDKKESEEQLYDSFKKLASFLDEEEINNVIKKLKKMKEEDEGDG